jgi:hypothetical protein
MLVVHKNGRKEYLYSIVSEAFAATNKECC